MRSTRTNSIHSTCPTTAVLICRGTAIFRELDARAWSGARPIGDRPALLPGGGTGCPPPQRPSVARDSCPWSRTSRPISRSPNGAHGPAPSPSAGGRGGGGGVCSGRRPTHNERERHRQQQEQGGHAEPGAEAVAGGPPGQPRNLPLGGVARSHSLGCLLRAAEEDAPYDRLAALRGVARPL